VRLFVDCGPLPWPAEIGNLVRWRWQAIEDHILARAADRAGAAPVGVAVHDEFSQPVHEHAKTP
jgi:hypothetical protein